MAKSAGLFGICTLLFFLAQAVRADFQCPANYSPSTTMGRLKSHVFCSYDPYSRPVRQHKDTVDVRLGLVLKRIQFDEKRDILQVHSIFAMRWYDYNLLWDPAKYDNIEKLNVESSRIWTPDVGVFTSADETSFTPYLRATMCVVYSNGYVWCALPTTHTASCSADLTRWPYDRHTCKLVLGSWAHTGEKVNISLMKKSVYLHGYNMNREWQLVAMTSYRHSGHYSCCPNDTYPSVTFQIELQRHSGSYTAIVVMPAVVLMLMTLATWMKRDQSNRLILAAMDVFFHFLFLQYLGNILPSNGDSSPLIVTFYRDSMFLATMALLTTIIGRNLRRTSTSLPIWISGLSNWVLRSRFGQALIYRNLNPKVVATASDVSGDEGAGLVDDADSQSTDWNTFISLIDLTCFLITFVTYFILLLGFIP